MLLDSFLRVMNTTLEVSGLCVRPAQDSSAVPILLNVSFDVAEGETLVLLGESGSGKAGAVSAQPCAVWS